MEDATSDTDRLTLRRDLSEIQRMALWVEDIVQRRGLSEALAFRLQLCLEEAVTNVMRHGAVADGRPEILVALAERDGAVAACIEDEGQAFDPLQQPAPEPVGSLEEAKLGGLGIHLIRQFATRIAYRREGSRNRLVLTFDRS